MLYRLRSESIDVQVRPRFSLSRSSVEGGRYVFTYDVHIENHRAEPVQLLYRHWRIHDSTGEESEIEGEGVVGVQPVILPGAAHEYRSFCVLSSPMGRMEGSYTFATEDGASLRIPVPAFELVGPLVPPGGVVAEPVEEREWN